MQRDPRKSEVKDIVPVCSDTEQSKPGGATRGFWEDGDAHLPWAPATGVLVCVKSPSLPGCTSVRMCCTTTQNLADVHASINETAVSFVSFCQG